MCQEQESIVLEAQDFDISKFNATLTLTSPRTGEHRTFRVKTVRKGKLEGQRLVELLIGSNNEADYKAFAHVGNDKTPWLKEGEARVWGKHRGTQYERFLDLLARPSYWAGKGVIYQISGHCRRCNRTLTHPESLTSGYGPECIKHV